MISKIQELILSTDQLFTNIFGVSSCLAYIFNYRPSYDLFS